MVLGAIPAGCRRALDAGCGTGALTRRLRGVIPQVTGIDRDEQSIATARTHPQARDIGHRHEDFLTAAFEAESFRLVASMAAVHQMDAGAALARMAKRPPAGRATAASRPTSHLFRLATTDDLPAAATAGRAATAWRSIPAPPVLAVLADLGQALQPPAA